MPSARSGWEWQLQPSLPRRQLSQDTIPYEHQDQEPDFQDQWLSQGLGDFDDVSEAMGSDKLSQCLSNLMSQCSPEPVRLGIPQPGGLSEQMPAGVLVACGGDHMLPDVPVSPGSSCPPESGFQTPPARQRDLEHAHSCHYKFSDSPLGQGSPLSESVGGPSSGSGHQSQPTSSGDSPCSGSAGSARPPMSPRAFGTAHQAEAAGSTMRLTQGQQEASDDAKAPKRRRLNGKQPAPCDLDPMVVSFRAERPSVQRNRYRQDSARKWGMREIQMKRSLPRPGELYDEHRQRLRSTTWHQQPELVRAAWFYAIKKNTVPMQAQIELDRVAEKAQEGDLTSGLNEDLRSRGLLFTFNGNWGMDLPEVVKLHRSGAGPEEMVDVLRQLPYYSALLERFVQECFHDGMKDRGFSNFSAAVEFSMHAKNLGRVHLHLFVSTTRIKYRVNDARTFLSFDNRAPGHVCQTGGALKGRIRQTQESIDRAHYYLQFSKRGSLVQRCNWVKHYHFVVKPAWILQLFKLHKIEQEDLVHELIACRCEKLTFLLEGIKNIEKQAFQESEYKRIREV